MNSEMNSETISVPAVIENALKTWTGRLQNYSLLSVQSVRTMFVGRKYFGDLLQQMDQVGVGSLLIVVVALFCVGGVVVLNAASQFARFGETVLTGDAVSLALRVGAGIRGAAGGGKECHGDGVRARVDGGERSGGCDAGVWDRSDPEIDDAAGVGDGFDFAVAGGGGSGLRADRRISRSEPRVASRRGDVYDARDQCVGVWGFVHWVHEAAGIWIYYRDGRMFRGISSRGRDGGSGTGDD
jgi:hypothetical protein